MADAKRLPQRPTTAKESRPAAKRAGLAPKSADTERDTDRWLTLGYTVDQLVDMGQRGEIDAAEMRDLRDALGRAGIIPATTSKTPGHVALDDYAKLALGLGELHATVRLARLALIGALHEIDAVVPVHERTGECLNAFTEPVRDTLETLYERTAAFADDAMAIGGRLCAAVCRKAGA